MVRGMNEERLNKEGTVRGKLMREQGRVGWVWTGEVGGLCRGGKGGRELNEGRQVPWRKSPKAVISIPQDPHRIAGASLSPRLCRRTSRESSVANRVLGNRMKILVLGGQQ